MEVTYAVYAYRPISLWSLGLLLEHGEIGPTAQFERFAAELLRIIAGNRQIDYESTESFPEKLERIYRNPFEEKKKPKLQTRKEIEEYVIKIFSE